VSNASSSGMRRLHLVANARMPSQRAQSLQVAQAAASFARAGVETKLWYARRRDTGLPSNAAELWDHYAVPQGIRPDAEAVGCIDTIDMVPRSMQFMPARLQELTFARGAVRRIRKLPESDWVVTREVEVAALLAHRPHVALELHRVPGGRLRQRCLKQVIDGAGRLLAISGGVRDDLIEQGAPKGRIHVAHDGFEPARFAGLPSRDEACATLGLDPGLPVVVYTGGLMTWKGVDVLVDAARGMQHVQFVIAGGMDADVAALRAFAQGVEHVRVDGFQAPQRIATYLAAADIGVVPNRVTPSISSRYTSPLKVFEAMAVGLPLVVSDLFSLRDILTEDQAQFVRPEDPAALAEGLAVVLGDLSRRQAMSAALRCVAPENTWDARAARILEFLETAA
jgi:glycosyltransferase involved in cell wall biosynthesis